MKQEVKVVEEEEEELTLKPFDSKSPFIRYDRVIAPRRPDFPRILCPLIVEISLLEELDISQFPEVMLTESVPPRRLRLYCMSAPDWRPVGGSWKETNNDLGTHGEWRRTALRAVLRGETSLKDETTLGNFGTNVNALLLGPFPITWLVADPEFQPRGPTLALYPNSKLSGFFRLWGPLDGCDCIFQDNGTMLLCVKYMKRPSLIQAALCFFSRFIMYNGEARALNMQAVNYQDTLEGMASRLPGQLGTVLKQLLPEQQQIFRTLYTRMETLEGENQVLAMNIQEKHQEMQRNLRMAAKPKSFPAKRPLSTVNEAFHKELLG
eukprot:GEMP01041385.1.p1 GENE.GEMP01041385.1~~GEMP01041385.1.p1  ORF type:complete len:322 (+),score=52.94 GEMP01041385.1:267-1232(+)